MEKPNEFIEICGSGMANISNTNFFKLPLSRQCTFSASLNRWRWSY